MMRINGKIKLNEDFIEGISWIEKNRAKLRQAYQGSWIAVYKTDVVASGKTINVVEKEALQKTHLSLNHIPIIFIEDPHCIY